MLCWGGYTLRNIRTTQQAVYALWGLHLNLHQLKVKLLSLDNER